ncbi:MAG: sigma-54-dependent Fis family transcriptional regulator [Verrucomicrobiota bacterium JB023]|nr:sigma-54-dependent Fis family transcriptional regulator [Verrucomicrobiota bacterium JB023]
MSDTALSPIILLAGLADAEGLGAKLAAQGLICTALDEAGESAAWLAEHRADAIVLPLRLPLLRRLHVDFPSLPIIVLGTWEDSDDAIEAVQAGAYDFLPEPVDADELAELLGEAIPGGEESAPPLPATETIDNGLVGRSRAMGKLYRDIAKLAATPVTVLIRGETGSGKELVARALWQHGHRAHVPLVVVNCAAIPENLLESELFGYERGAFTGATTARKGKFEQANGSTLFLDEIGDMSLPLQAKMLRVLQEKRVERVGGKGEVPVDVRLIAATHQPLEKMVEEGRFREDLYYRLQTATLQVPPLRDRMGDVELLTNFFLQRFQRELDISGTTLSREALSLLVRQPWPGNVRQLQNVLRRAVLKRRGLLIGKEDIRQLLDAESRPMGATSRSLGELALEALEEAEAQGEGNALRAIVAHAEEAVIREALKRSGGNQSKASRWLGITRLTLREKLKALAR